MLLPFRSQHFNMTQQDTTIKFGLSIFYESTYTYLFAYTKFYLFCYTLFSVRHLVQKSLVYYELILYYLFLFLIALLLIYLSN